MDICIFPSIQTKAIADNYGVSEKDMISAMYLYQDNYKKVWDPNDPDFVEFMNVTFKKNSYINTNNLSDYQTLKSFWDASNDGVFDASNATDMVKISKQLEETFGKNNYVKYTDSNGKVVYRIAQPTINGYTQEMLDIKGKTIFDDTFMKAANSEPTNIIDSKTTKQKLDNIINFCNKNFQFDKENHEYWILKDGKRVAKATTTASGYKYSNKNGLRYETTNSENLGNFFLPSTTLGTTVDNITRLFFNGKVTLDKVIDGSIKFPNFSQPQLENLVRDLTLLKDWADKQGITLMSADFPMIGSINGELVGGAMDLIGYTEDGDIYIFDMKNKRSLNDSKTLKQHYNGQQNVYTGLFNSLNKLINGDESLRIKGLKILQFNSEDNISPEYRDTKYTVDKNGQLSADGINIQDMPDYNAPRLVLQNKNVPADFTLDLLEPIYNQISSIPEDVLMEITGAETAEEAKTNIENELANNGQVIPKESLINQHSNALHNGSIKDSDLLKISNGIIVYASNLYDKLSKGDEKAMKLYQKITGITIPNLASNEYKTFERAVKGSRDNMFNEIPLGNVLNYIKESIWREDYEFALAGGHNEIEEDGTPIYSEQERYIYNTIKTCYENFDALIENAYAKFAELEQRSLSKGVDKEDMHFDGEITETTNVDTETTSNKDTEHWMIEQMSVKNSLSGAWRRIINKIYARDEKNNIKYTEFGLPETLSADTTINNLLFWFKSCTNVDDMISVLEKRIKYYPEYQPILDIIKADEQLKSQFFQNFRKDFQTYSITIANKNRKTNKIEYVTKVINNSSATDFLISRLGYKFATGFKLLNDILVTDKKGVKHPKIKEINEYHAKISKVKNLFKTKEDFENIDNRAEFANLMDSFGLNFNRQTIGMFFDDASENVTYGRNQLSEIFSNLNNILFKCENAKDINYSLFKENFKDGEVNVKGEYKNILQYFNDYMEEVIESSCYENGKMHYSFNPPSYTGKLFINLKNSTENTGKFNEFIENEYGKYKWFAVNNDKPGEEKKWLTPMLDLMFQTREGNLTPLAQKAREALNHKTQLAFNKTPYVELSPLAYLTSIFTEFFTDKTNERYSVANYRMPIQSNKPSSEFISFIRFNGSNYKRDMIPYFQNVCIQELMRMRTVLEMAINPAAISIANYNIKKPSDELKDKIKKNELTWEDVESLSGSGIEFKFLSFLNNLNTEKYDGATELKSYFLDYLNHKEVSAEILMENFGKVFTVKMQETFDKQNEYFDSIGLYDTVEEAVRDSYGIPLIDENGNQIYQERLKNLDFLNLKSKTLSEQITEAKSLLENFFWNDMLMSINIIEITATDLAYYKNVEDFQKRFAQVHAPGLRLNTKAQHKIDGKLQDVSDGKSRTLYLKDLEYNTGIENDVAIAFDTLIEKETNADRKSALRTMKAVVSKSLKSVNVADAQAFTSPTGMMKKLVMAGKWTDDMVEAYERICEGVFDFTDLNVLMQPLKPFVYSQIEKNSGAQTMNTIKVGLQNKNSEYMILLSDAIMRSAGKSANKLTALFDFMEASAYDGRVVVRNRKVYKDNVYVRDAYENETDGQILERGTYNKHGVDTIQFESAVKVGKSGVIDTNDSSYENIIENLKHFSASENKNELYDDRYVHTFSYEDYAVQQEVPAHLIDHHQLMGSQMRVLVFSDMLPQTPFEFVTRNGEQLTTAKDVIKHYQDLIGKNIEESFKLLEKQLKFDANTSISERNRVMSELLLSEIKKDSRYGADLKRACELKDGKFVIPLSDPIQSVRIQQLIHSIIKSRINKQKVSGGPVVQATSWGIDKKYKIVWEDEKHSKLKHFECAAPVPSTELEMDLITLARKIDGNDYNGRLATPQEAVKYGLISDEQLKSIGYRIPTEDKYSMYPMKIVEWVPRAAGEVIILPEEITKLTGSDFDIDKTYMYLKSFKRVVDYDGIKDILSKRGYSEEEIVNAINVWNNGESGIVDRLIRKSQQRFIHYYEEKKDNKNGRNNEIFDIQWAMLTHPNTIDKMFNPGSFDVQKATAAKIQLLQANVGYKWDDLKNMSLDELENELKFVKTKEDKNIVYVSTQVQFFKQNMTAGKLIGIFANNNVSHAFVQQQNVTINFNPKEPIIFDGVSFEDNMKLDDVYANDGITYISKNIAGFVGASVDAVKDPVLNYMNFNTFTAGIGMLLTRMGFDVDSVGLFLSQPSILKATQLYDNLNNDGYISSSDAVAKLLDELQSNWRDTLKQTSSNLSKKDLAENINNPINDNFQIEVLKTFYKLIAPSQNLNVLTFVTKFNSISNAAGPNISDTILMNKRVTNFIENIKSDNPAFSESALKVLTDSPILFNYWKYTVSDEGAAKRIFETWFPHYTSKFEDIINEYVKNTKSPLTDKVFDKLLNEFLLYKFTYQGSPFAKYFTSERRDYFINKFSKEFVEFKEKHPELSNNVLLSAINIKTGTKRCNIYTLDSQVGGYSSELQELAKVNWSDMFQSEDEEIREMGEKLFVYCLYRNGFGFSPKTFIHLASVKTKLSLGYTKLLNDVSFFDDDVVVERFLEQFKRNHITETNIVPKVDIKTSEKGSVTLYPNKVTFKANKKEFINDLLSNDKKNVISMINFNNKYYRLTEDKNIDGDNAFIVYEEVEPLGNKNNFLEYDMNAIYTDDITTVISKYKVDDDSADNDYDDSDNYNDYDESSSSQTSDFNDMSDMVPINNTSLEELQSSLKALGMEVDNSISKSLDATQEEIDQSKNIQDETNICK